MAATVRVRAPELEGAGGFIGTAGPLTLAALRGRVVLLDFFTESCINCVHVLSELRELEAQFGDDLLVIGIHSPKFPHERDHEAVVRAVERLGITHPVLDDPDLRTWSAYTVQAWPTLVLIDPEGYIAHQVSGEGHGAYIAQGVATLLDAHRAKGSLVRGPLPVVPVAPPPRTGLRYPGKVAHDPERGCSRSPTPDTTASCCSTAAAWCATSSARARPRVRMGGSRRPRCRHRRG